MITDAKRSIGLLLDRWVSPFVQMRHYRYSAFRMCGFAGLCLALLAGVAATVHRGLPCSVLFLLSISSVATFLCLAMLTKIVVGDERLIYYHHEIAIVVTSGFVLWLIGQLILAFLDIVLLGVGSFLACGRIGCFLVGCCHGRPHAFGVCYRDQHAAVGFPASLVGIRLFPIQLVESAAVASIVAVGLLMIWRDAQPGSILTWYSIAYGLVRFTIEFFRGDGSRPYLGSFSEAQWTTLLLITLTAVAELTGVLPLQHWHVAAMAGLMIFMIAWAAKDGFTRRLFRPAHIEQLAALLKSADSSSRISGELHIGQTELGVQLSASVITRSAQEADIIAFSVPNRSLESRTVARLARLISQLKGRDGRLVEGKSGVYHMVFSSSGGERAV